MKMMMFGAMMAGLLGLLGASATTAQVVAGDGWWSSEYEAGKSGYDRQGRGREEANRRGDYRNSRDDDRRGRDEYYRGDDGYYGESRVDVYREREGRYDERGRVDVRPGRVDVRPGRVGVRLPGRVVVTARPSVRIRGRHAPAFYWTEVNWNVRFRERYVGHGYRASLKDIVGKKTFKQLRRHRDRLHIRGALSYRWVDLGRRGMMLQVRAGQVPIAELIDFGSDCYVDIVRLNQSAW